MVDQPDPGEQLEHEQDDQPDQEQRVAQLARTPQPEPEHRQQRPEHEQDAPDRDEERRHSRRSRPGISANSDTVSALEKAVSAVAARIRWICVSPCSSIRSIVTETATNSSPTSAPATPAAAVKNSW